MNQMNFAGTQEKAVICLAVVNSKDSWRRRRNSRSAPTKRCSRNFVAAMNGLLRNFLSFITTRTHHVRSLTRRNGSVIAQGSYVMVMIPGDSDSERPSPGRLRAKISVDKLARASWRWPR